MHPSRSWYWISGTGPAASAQNRGKMLSSRTRRSGGRAAALLRLAAVTVGRTDTALGAFYRRLSSRIGKAKAVTATTRKVAVLFYNAVRHGMEYVDPGASESTCRVGHDLHHPQSPETFHPRKGRLRRLPSNKCPAAMPIWTGS